MSESKTNIQIFGNGPLKVSGKCAITLADGTIEEKENVTLCRCGASSNKPFCDGQHKKIGFEG